MLPDRVSNPGPLTYESGALPIALRGPAQIRGPQPFGLCGKMCASVAAFTIMFEHVHTLCAHNSVCTQ